MPHIGIEFTTVAFTVISLNTCGTTALIRLIFFLWKSLLAVQSTTFYRNMYYLKKKKAKHKKESLAKSIKRDKTTLNRRRILIASLLHLKILKTIHPIFFPMNNFLIKAGFCSTQMTYLRRRWTPQDQFSCFKKKQLFFKPILIKG